MEMTQMNTRLPVDLKSRGDAVARKHGKNPSEIVRAVWEYMAQHDDVPECAKEPKPSSEEVTRRRDAIQRATQMVPNFYREHGIKPLEGPIDYKELRDQMYEEKLKEYLAL